MTDSLARLRAAGVSVWLDDLSRDRLISGSLAALARDKHVSGVTTNPTIFARSIIDSNAYAGQLRDLRVRQAAPDQALRELTTSDVRWACDVLQPAYEATGEMDGRVSIEVDPRIGRLHARVGEVLGAMAGATGVYLLLWSEDRQDWLLPAPESEGVSVSSTGREHAIPMSVLWYVQRTREPVVAADATRDDLFARDPYFAGIGCCSLLAVPIVSRGALRAVLVLENRLIHGAFSAERLDAVQLIAGQLAVSLDNAQLYAELTASRARIVAVADQARRRIERDLHDGAQQRLVSLGLQLRAIQATMPPEMGAQLDQVAHGLTGALEELREIARGIHPAALADGGLRPALKALARRSPVPVDLDIRSQQRLPEQVEVSAYYFVAEALTNAAKHARASSVTVTAEADAAVLRLAVRDDGAGGADFTRGTGLVGLKDRVEAIGGRLFLDSPPEGGTRLCAELPLTPTTASPPASAGAQSSCG